MSSNFLNIYKQPILMTNLVADLSNQMCKLPWITSITETAIRKTDVIHDKI